MIKIKNNILIYFIFYINNISFLRNEEVPNQVLINEKDENIQIQENNNQEINSEQKNENIILKNDENEIKNYKSFFNKILNKKNKNILLVFFEVSLLFILYLCICKIKQNKEKELIINYIKDNIDNIDFIIGFYNPISKYKVMKDRFEIKKKMNF